MSASVKNEFAHRREANRAVVIAVAFTCSLGLSPAAWGQPSKGCGASKTGKTHTRVKIDWTVPDTVRSFETAVSAAIELRVSAKCPGHPPTPVNPDNLVGASRHVAVVRYDEGPPPADNSGEAGITLGPHVARAGTAPDTVEARAGGRIDGDVDFVAATRHYTVKKICTRLEQEVNCLCECDPANRGRGTGKAGVIFRDPVVIGTGTYVSSVDGETYDAFPPAHDGTYRYITDTLIFDPPVGGPAPNGELSTERYSTLVRPGGDDDPYNEDGILVYELLIEESIDGNMVTFIPGMDTAEFALTFDKTPEQIETEVLAHLEGSDPLTVVTATVTLLADEDTMPMVTNLSRDDWIPDPGQVPWAEDLDFYEAGSGLHGQAGWKGWDDDPAWDAFVTDAQAQSDPHSADIGTDSDLVHEFSGADAGQWTFAGWAYVPSDFQSGCDAYDNCGSYFILLNTYADGGPYNWSCQLRADSLTGTFIRDGVIPATAPLITDRWVEVAVLIDLDSDLYQVFYDGAELGAAESWTAGIFGDDPDGVLSIAALDLFANGSTSVYWDDLFLVPNEPACAGDLDGDGVTGQTDLGILLADWGCSGGGCAGDLDGDGSTGQADLGILLADWGCGV